MLSEITYPFPNVYGAIVEVWEWISNFIPHWITSIILVHAGIKLKHFDRPAVTA